MKLSQSILSPFAIAASLAGLAAIAPVQASAQDPGQTFKFSKDRPRLVVLLHGVTPKYTEDKEAGIGLSKHAQYYWGFDFIKGLQGRTEEDAMHAFTPTISGQLNYKLLRREDWNYKTAPENGFELAPIYVNTRLASAPGIGTSQTLMKQYLNLATRGGAESTMVMVNTREGSKHFMPQLGETVDEIYRSYIAAFGHLEEKFQPQIYLVGHSFGGIIARGILANPTAPDLFGGTLTATQRQRCDFLRARVVLVKTLSSPHEGTPIPKMTQDVAKYLRTTGYNLVYSTLQSLVYPPFRNAAEPYIRAKTKETIQMALDAVSGERDCLEDLKRMSEYNTGILNPNTMRRRTGGTDLVPIYTANGRNPGDMYFSTTQSVFLLGGSTWNPWTNIDIASGYNRMAKQAMALTLIERLMRSQGYGKAQGFPWGRATNPLGDTVRSPMAGIGKPIRSASTPLSLSAQDVKDVAAAFFDGKPYGQTASDGEWDTDGFLGWDSGHALTLPGRNWYRVYAPAQYGGFLPWDIDNHGSMMFNVGVGLWINNELIRGAGPYVGASGNRVSGWTTTEMPTIPRYGVRVDFAELHDLDNNLDTFTGADMTMTVRVGGVTQTWNAPNQTRTVTKIPSFTLTNFASPVIPIRVSVMERDRFEISADPDDQCVVTPISNRTDLYVYYDVRTGRISGDVSGAQGDLIASQPWNSSIANRVRLKFKVTRIQ
jgi:hypothetical protein